MCVDRMYITRPPFALMTPSFVRSCIDSIDMCGDPVYSVRSVEDFADFADLEDFEDFEDFEVYNDCEEGHAIEYVSLHSSLPGVGRGSGTYQTRRPNPKLRRRSSVPGCRS